MRISERDRGDFVQAADMVVAQVAVTVDRVVPILNEVDCGVCV